MSFCRCMESSQAASVLGNDIDTAQVSAQKGVWDPETAGRLQIPGHLPSLPFSWEAKYHSNDLQIETMHILQSVYTRVCILKQYPICVKIYFYMCWDDTESNFNSICLQTACLKWYITAQTKFEWAVCTSAVVTGTQNQEGYLSFNYWKGEA